MHCAKHLPVNHETCITKSCISLASTLDQDIVATMLQLATHNLVIVTAKHSYFIW